MLRRVWRGPEGVRSVWRVGIFLLVLAVPSTALQILLAHQGLKMTGEVRPGPMLAAEAASVALMLGATWLVAWIEGRSVLDYGLRSRRVVADAAAGWLGGLVSLSVLVGVLWAGGYVVFGGVVLGPGAAVAYGAVWLLVFLLIGVAEEMVFRGYLQVTLARRLGFWPAGLVMSVLFAAAHLGNPGETAFGLAGVVCSGLLFCLLLRVSGSLWLGIGFHCAWDWAQSYLYGVPDSALMFRGHLLASHAVGDVRFSGGSAGPEGSVLLPVGMIVVPLLLVWVWGAVRGLGGGRQ